MATDLHDTTPHSPGLENSSTPFTEARMYSKIQTIKDELALQLASSPPEMHRELVINAQGEQIKLLRAEARRKNGDLDREIIKMEASLKAQGIEPDDMLDLERALEELMKS